MLMDAAKAFAPLDAALSRETYLDAWHAAVAAGQFAGVGDLRDVSRAALSAPRPAGAPGPSDLLLDGLAVLATKGRAQAAPLLRRAARVFAGDEITIEERLRWSPVAVIAAVTVWDEECFHAIQARELQSCREAGLLNHLMTWVNAVALLTIWRGDFAGATSMIAEGEAIAAATRTCSPSRPSLSPVSGGPRPRPPLRSSRSGTQPGRGPRPGGWMRRDGRPAVL